MAITPFYNEMSKAQADEFVNDWVDFMIKKQTTEYVHEEQLKGQYICKKVMVILILKK